MDLSLPALLVLLAPPLAAIVILRPSWPEFLLLVSPLIVAMLVALLAFSLASFIALGLFGLLIALGAFSIEADDQGLMSSSVTAGVLDRFLRAREREPLSERASRHNQPSARLRRFQLAKVIGAELVIVSGVTWYLAV